MKKSIQLFFLLFLCYGFSQNSLLQSGPMVGYCEMKEAVIWLQAKENASVKIDYFAIDNPTKVFTSETYNSTKESAFTYHVILDKLEPGKKYNYTVYINNKKVILPYETSFSSKKLWQWREDAPDFMVAFGSCMYINETALDRPGKPYGSGYNIFESIANKNPDIMIWGGDNTYLREADWDSKTGIYHRNTHSRSIKELQPLLAKTQNFAVWDDHEFANDAYKDGAENHTPATEGSFAARKAAAMQAYHEWMPIRTGVDKSKIYRSFNFGNLISLHMLDTRSVGRDQQVDIADLVNPSKQVTALATLSSPSRQMMGVEQVQWLQTQMATSTATWQILGQQVLMARIEFPLTILQALNPSDTSAQAQAAGQKAIADYLTAKAKQAQSYPLSPTESALLSQPKLGYNLDAWDGYPAAREIVLATAAQLKKRLVVLAGDTHNAWHSDLTLLSGQKVGEEFATSSVSSPGLEAYLSLPPAQVKAIFEGVVKDLKWMDSSRRGYLKLTVNANQVQGEWFFIDTITSKSYKVDVALPAEKRTYAA